MKLITMCIYHCKGNCAVYVGDCFFRFSDFDYFTRYYF